MVKNSVAMETNIECKRSSENLRRGADRENNPVCQISLQLVDPFFKKNDTRTKLILASE